MHGAAAGVGTGEVIVLGDQRGLIEAQQLGVGAHIATGEGVPGQTLELPGLQLDQRVGRQVELAGHLGHLPALLLAGQTQGFAGVVPRLRCGCFGVRHGHFCSARYC
ncbi:hypothetical protein D3C81_2092220 [compost metagenome]